MHKASHPRAPYAGFRAQRHAANRERARGYDCSRAAPQRHVHDDAVAVRRRHRALHGSPARRRPWLQRRPEIQVLPVSYADALGDPAQTAARLARFLGQPFDESAAAMAVDPSLRRQKPLAEMPV
jgi:hypothetical protein